MRRVVFFSSGCFRFIRVIFFIGSIVCAVHNVMGYGLPFINLGLTNFLDGGPIRPSPGWYWMQYGQYYHTHKFLDAEGKLLGGVPSPTFNAFAAITQFIYQFNEPRILKAQPGIDVALPLVLYSHISPNSFGFTDSGSGLGDLFLGVYLQWDPFMYHDRPLFVHRIEFATIFPIGKNKEPLKNINPGNNFFYINPYWSATLFLTERWTVSWRLSYLWCGTDHKTHFKPGTAVHMNYNTEYEIIDNLHVGINGYFLQQLTNNKLFGKEVPHSKERVLGIGPGALYFFSRDFIVFGNFYVERKVLNRPQGINAVLRLVLHF